MPLEEVQARADMPRRALRDALALLHDWGHVLWFRDALPDRVVLAPQWLADVMSAVVSQRQRVGDATDDFLRDDQLDTVWRGQLAAGGVEPAQVLRVLLTLGVAFQVRDEFGRPQGLSCVPAMLRNPATHLPPDGMAKAAFEGPAARFVGLSGSPPQPKPKLVGLSVRIQPRSAVVSTLAAHWLGRLGALSGISVDQRTQLGAGRACVALNGVALAVLMQEKDIDITTCGTIAPEAAVALALGALVRTCRTA